MMKQKMIQKTIKKIIMKMIMMIWNKMSAIKMKYQKIKLRINK